MSNVTRHLRNAHNLVMKRRRSEARESETHEVAVAAAASLRECLNTAKKRQIRSLVTTVNVDKMRKCLISWIVQEQIPFKAVSATSFREFLLCLAPTLERYIPKSHSTVADWVKEDFGEARKSLITQLAASQSRIHISFDIWTSPACTAFLGICAHFLDIDMRLKHALIGVKELEGVHNGENISTVITQVIVAFNIKEKVGVFVGDNANNVDNAVECLRRSLWPDELIKESRRARCLAHIINLGAKAFVFGENCEAFINEMTDNNEVYDEEELQKERLQWRKKGVIGKFDNICRFIRQTPQRRQDFIKLVRRTVDSGEAIDYTSEIQVILENSTRWNSTYLSIERGLKLRTPISYYLAGTPALAADSLTALEWNQLAAIYAGLQPFWEITLRIEGHAKNGAKGVIWEALPALTHLLSHCEMQVAALKEAIRLPGHSECDKYLLLCFQNAWDKLDKYNTLSDDHHDLYAAGVLLNPCLKQVLFEEVWTGKTAEWIPIMMQTNQAIWEDKYKENIPIPPPNEFRSSLDISLLSTMRSRQVLTDEFATYLSTPPEAMKDWSKDSNLFEWWLLLTSSR